MAIPWELVHIFISSTFNDMHAERDYLVKQVFPQLREWCEKRKLRLVDIDLRWGVTEQDATARNVVKVCLDRINDCRPFFLCFLGQRRGWVPGREQISLSTFKDFPSLEKHAGLVSITELEILHALINPLHEDCKHDPKKSREFYEVSKHAFFYLRQDSYLSQLPADPPQLRQTYTNEGFEDKDLRELQNKELDQWRNQKIPALGRPIRKYCAQWKPFLSTPELLLPMKCPSVEQKAIQDWQDSWRKAGVNVNGLSVEEDPKARVFNQQLIRGRLADFRCDDQPLSQVIIADLKIAISTRFPDHIEIGSESKLQKELDQQDQFLYTGCQGFIERGSDFDELDAYVQGDSDQLFVLTAPGGMGKSSLLAQWVERNRTNLKELPCQSLHFRFIGQGDRSTSVYSLLYLLLCELKEVTGKIAEEIPDDPHKLRQELPKLLEAAGKKGRTVIILDGLNQLESGLSDLAWLPYRLPQNIKLIVSFKRGDAQAEVLLNRLQGQAILSEVKPFDNLEHRRCLVDKYLDQFLKQLDRPLVDALIQIPGASNPLFLKVVLTELRIFGAFGNLGEKICSDFGETPVTAFNAVLNRLELDPAYSSLDPKDAVPLLFGLLAHARQGLTVDELVSLLIQKLILPDEGSSHQAAADTIHLYLRQVRPFLAQRAGRYDFFFESFKLAVKKRYAYPDPSLSGNNKIDLTTEGMGDYPFKWMTSNWHRMLAEYFQQQPLYLEGEKSKNPNLHKLSEQAFQQAQAGMADELVVTLTDIDILYETTNNLGPQAVIDEFEMMDEPAMVSSASLQACRTDLDLILSAVRLAAPIVASQASQLPGQLLGRLGSCPQPFIQMFLHRVRAWRGSDWLQPLTASLSLATGPLQATLTGHDYVVNDALVTADGKKAVSAGGDGTVRVWDLANGTQVVAIKGMAGYIKSLALTPDDRYILAGARGGTSGHLLALWEVQSGGLVQAYDGQHENVLAVVISQDGQKVVSAVEDGSICSWSISQPSPLRVIQVGQISCMAFSPNGRYAAIQPKSDPQTQSQVSLLDLVEAVQPSMNRQVETTGTLKGSLKKLKPERTAYLIAYSPDGRQLATVHPGDQQSQPVICIWDATTGDEIHRLSGLTAKINVLEFHPTNDQLYSGAEDGTLRIWDLTTGRLISTISMDSGKVTAIQATKDGNYCLIGTSSGIISLWDLEHGAQLCLMKGHTDSITRIIFTPDERLAISAAQDYSLRIWDWRLTWKDRKKIVGHDTGIKALAFSLDGQRGYSAAEDGSLRIWNLSQATQISTFYAPAAPVKLSPQESSQVWMGCEDGLLMNLDANGTTLSPVGKIPSSKHMAFAEWSDGRLVYCVQGMDLHILDPDNCQKVGELETIHNAHTLWDLVSTLNGAIVAGVYWDGTLDVWNGLTGELINKMKSPRPLLRLAITSDGSQAITGSNNGELSLWDLSKGQMICSWQAYARAGSVRWIKALALSPDGSWAVSGGNDWIIKLWSLPHGELVACFAGESEISQCAISADGQAILAGEISGKVHLLKSIQIS